MGVSLWVQLFYVHPSFFQKAKATIVLVIIEGMSLRGKIMRTIVDGKTVWDGHQIINT